MANDNKAKNQVKIFRHLLALCSSSLAAASAFSSSTSAPTSGRKTIQSRRKTKLCEWRTDAGIKHFYLSLAITSQSPSQDYQLPLTKTWPFIKSAVKFGTTHSISRNTMDCRTQLWSRPGLSVFYRDILRKQYIASFGKVRKYRNTRIYQNIFMVFFYAWY